MSTARIMSYILIAAFGAFMAAIGYSLSTWQLWVALLLVSGYGAARHEEPR